MVHTQTRSTAAIQPSKHHKTVLSPEPLLKIASKQNTQNTRRQYHSLRTLHGLSQQKWSMRTRQHLYVLPQMPQMPRQTPHLPTMPPKFRQQDTPAPLQHHYTNKLHQSKKVSPPSRPPSMQSDFYITYRRLKSTQIQPHIFTRALPRDSP